MPAWSGGEHVCMESLLPSEARSYPSAHTSPTPWGLGQLLAITEKVHEQLSRGQGSVFCVPCGRAHAHSDSHIVGGTLTEHAAPFTASRWAFSFMASLLQTVPNCFLALTVMGLRLGFPQVKFHSTTMASGLFNLENALWPECFLPLRSSGLLCIHGLCKDLVIGSAAYSHLLESHWINSLPLCYSPLALARCTLGHADRGWGKEFIKLILEKIPEFQLICGIN